MRALTQNKTRESSEKDASCDMGFLLSRIAKTNNSKSGSVTSQARYLYVVT